MEPPILNAVQPRPPQDVADMAVVIQANLVQLQVADGRRGDSRGVLSELRLPSPGAVLRYREALISRDVLAGHDAAARLLRAHEAWGQFCVLCWFFHVGDPHRPPDFRSLPAGVRLRCPGEVLNKTVEIERGLWRLRFEQRRRSDPGLKADPDYERAYRRALRTPATVLGESVQVCGDNELVLGGCEYAGMLAAARWVSDTRWRWGQEGIMELPADAGG